MLLRLCITGAPVLFHTYPTPHQQFLWQSLLLINSFCACSAKASAICELKRAIVSLTTEISSLQKLAQAGSRMMHSSKSAETLLMSMLEKANAQINCHLSTIEVLERDNTNLLAEVMDNDQLQKWCEARLAAAAATCTNLRKEMKQAKQEARSAQSQARATDNSWRVSQTNLAAAASTNTQLRRSLLESDKKLKTAEAANKKLVKQQQAAEAEAATLRGKLETSDEKAPQVSFLLFARCLLHSQRRIAFLHYPLTTESIDHFC